MENLTNEELDNLLNKAGKAESGPWKVKDKDPSWDPKWRFDVWQSGVCAGLIATCSTQPRPMGESNEVKYQQVESNAAFIAAANPETVKRLVSEILVLRGSVSPVVGETADLLKEVRRCINANTGLRGENYVVDDLTDLLARCEAALATTQPPAPAAAVTPSVSPVSPEQWQMPPRIVDIKPGQSMAPQWEANRLWAVVDYASGRPYGMIPGQPGYSLAALGSELQQAARFLAGKGIITIEGEPGAEVVLPTAPEQKARKEEAGED